MSAPRLSRSALTFVGLLLLSACGMMHRAAPLPDPRTEWETALAQAEREVLASRFGVADRVLADFAERHPNTNEGFEAIFWRAVFKLDPTNATATPHDAGALLDTYLAASLTVPHRGAATTLRRVSGSLERPAPAPAVASTSSTSTPSTATDKSKDEEVARLKDELAKANAELERIKRRVATPKP